MPTITYSVSGMTCSHCVAAVTEEISKLDGVHAVDVDLVAGGNSQVTVEAVTSLDDEIIRAAVAEAGYQLTGAAS